MKKISVLLFLLLVLSSCEEDIRFNNPSMQALKDNVFWRALNTTASVQADGSLLIEGQTRDEVFQLQTAETAIKRYVLGDGNASNVTYKIIAPEGQFEYETGTNAASGQIVITEYDTAAKTVSGTFRCSVESASGSPLVGNTVVFREGVFYKIPIK
ncbi:DUF6252 family protein [Flavobacterium sp. K77]|uniref:DUF6252 family protein n=1 Tax=Flavobacterium sp. K77 TaxID=2910676 RepID=UPI001F199EB7|nr:DUF6252 family protein [Flavobacterium sp. K77]MCF6141814.1 DUF6252 family protein [Flavobacterium sp. K77]